MDTRQVVARFEAERQALALMDHPNIARVLDAGATETGRPYFVMELVGGLRITDFCDRNNFGLRQRLELYRNRRRQRIGTWPVPSAQGAAGAFSVTGTVCVPRGDDEE